MLSGCENSEDSCSDIDTCSEDEFCISEPVVNRGHDEYSPNKTWIFTENVGLLYDISELISCIWKEIGRHLLKKESLIEIIDMENDKNGEKEKAYQLLVKWCRTVGCEANTNNLQLVLNHIGRGDVANNILSLCLKYEELQKRQQVTPKTERTKSEIEGHTKLQKDALRALKRSVKFYKREVKELRNKISDLSSKILENSEVRQLGENLELNNICEIQGELDSLQQQVYSMKEASKDMESSELDKQLQDVAKKLHAVEKTVIQHCHTLDDLQIAYYSECRIGGFARISCFFGSLKLPRGRTSERKKPLKQEEECDEDVFSRPEFRLHSTDQRSSTQSLFSSYSYNMQSKIEQFNKRNTYPKFLRTSEEHPRRKLSVSSIGDQFPQEFIANSQREFHRAMDFKSYSDDKNDQNSISYSFADSRDLPDPCYESSETIFSFVTKSPRNSYVINMYNQLALQGNLSVETYLV